MNYGLALDQAGREEEALAELERAVELGANAYSHVNLGVAYVKRGRLEEGLSHLQRAVDLWPSLPEARLALAHGLEQAGRIDEAERELREALRLRPDYLAGLRRAADFHQRHDRPAEALASFRRLLELDPGQGWVAERIRALERRSSPEALFAEAFAAWRRGNRDRAVELYEQLLAVAPDHRQGNFNLGWEYLAGSSEADWRRSAELFRKVVEIDPDYSEAVHHLASAYWKLGQKAEAVHWDRLFVARPDAHPELKRTSLARLEREGG